MLTTENGADLKRVFSAALDGTDMKYVLEEDAEEGKLLEITSDEELISTDEDVPDTTPARRNLLGEEMERETARMAKQQEKQTAVTRRNRKRQKKREKKLKKEEAKAKKRYVKADKRLRRVLQACVCLQLKNRLQTKIHDEPNWQHWKGFL